MATAQAYTNDLANSTSDASLDEASTLYDYASTQKLVVIRRYIRSKNLLRTIKWLLMR